MPEADVEAEGEGEGDPEAGGGRGKGRGGEGEGEGEGGERDSNRQKARDGEFRELTDSRTINSLVANINLGTVLKLHEIQRADANLESSTALIDRVVRVIRKDQCTMHALGGNVFLLICRVSGTTEQHCRTARKRPLRAKGNCIVYTSTIEQVNRMAYSLGIDSMESLQSGHPWGQKESQLLRCPRHKKTEGVSISEVSLIEGFHYNSMYCLVCSYPREDKVQYLRYR